MHRTGYKKDVYIPKKYFNELLNELKDLNINNKMLKEDNEHRSIKQNKC